MRVAQSPTVLKKETRAFESVSVPSCAPEVKRGNLSLNAWRILSEVGIKTLLGNMSLFPTYRLFLLTLFNTRTHTVTLHISSSCGP